MQQLSSRQRQARMRFIAMLKQMRVRHGFKSASSLSRAAGLTRTFVNNIELGLFFPSWSTLRKLSEAMGLTPVERSRLVRVAQLATLPTDVAAMLRPE